MPPSAPAPAPAYILAGPETGKREAFVAELRSSLATKDGSPPEYSRYYAGELPPEQLVGLLQNASLFSSRRVLEYRDAEAITGKAAIAALESYIRNPADDAVLLLVTEGYSLAKPIEAAVGAANKKMFWELRDSEKPAWIREKLARDRLSAEDGAIETILELVENETSALESACTVLAACFPPGERLDADKVEAVLSKSRQEDAFSLFDRMAGGELPIALGVLDTLLADRQSEPSQIIAALVWSFRRLERLQMAVGSDLSPEEAFRNEKISSKTGQTKFRKAMRRFTAEDCERIIRAASETEGALRGGYPASFARPLLHLFILSAMTGKKRSLILSGWKEEGYYPFD
ncbi:MAG: DNA polymerase III subunit delta [Rectinemataceae bacterium]|nr:DNA polymerase III subunit delta [Rectinemataceae bacterium]